MRTTAEVDTDITKVKKTISKLESDKAKNLELLQTARSTREQHALAALSSSNPKSQDKLNKARADQLAMQLEIEDVDFAISAARCQVDILTAERLESYKAEQWQEFERLSVVAIDQAVLYMGSVKIMAELLKEHAGTLRQMTGAAAAAGRPRVFKLAHARRFFDGVMSKILPYEFARPHPVYRDGDYEDFLKANIDGTAPPEPQEDEQKAS